MSEDAISLIAILFAVGGILVSCSAMLLYPNYKQNETCQLLIKQTSSAPSSCFK